MVVGPRCCCDQVRHRGPSPARLLSHWIRANNFFFGIGFRYFSVTPAIATGQVFAFFSFKHHHTCKCLIYHDPLDSITFIDVYLVNVPVGIATWITWIVFLSIFHWSIRVRRDRRHCIIRKNSLLIFAFLNTWIPQSQIKFSYKGEG